MRSKRKPTTVSARRNATSTSLQSGSKSRKSLRARRDGVTPSSGNVFADMGVANADEVLFKADLAIAIGSVIEKRRLSQSRAAEIAGIDQPKISALMSGDTRGFSADRLMKILTRLGQDIEIHVHDSKKPKGRIRVVAACLDQQSGVGK